jgi:hypothetical protein
VGNTFRNIPPSLYDLTQLEIIEFMGCCVKEIGEDISKLQSLKRLILPDNMLEKIPSGLLHIKTLRELELGGNNIGEEELLPFGKIKKLKLGKSHQGYQWNLKLLQDAKEKDYTEAEYAALCMKAVDDLSGTALRELDSTRLSPADYYAVCLAAVRKNGWSVEYIRADDFTVEQYLELCCEAVKKDSEAIKDIAIARFTPAQYKKLCLIAVSNNHLWAFLKNISPEKLSREDYLEVCHESIRHRPLTIVNMQDPPLDFWREAAGDVSKGAAHNSVVRDMPEKIQLQLYGKIFTEAELNPPYIPPSIAVDDDGFSEDIPF